MTAGPITSCVFFQFINVENKNPFFLIVFLFEWYWVAGENLLSSWLPQFHFLGITPLHNSFYFHISPLYTASIQLQSSIQSIPKFLVLGHFYSHLWQFPSLTPVSTNLYLVFLPSHWHVNPYIHSFFLKNKQKIFPLYWILFTVCTLLPLLTCFLVLSKPHIFTPSSLT